MIKLALILHLLGATIWTGGHLILAIGFLPQALRDQDPKIIEAFESKYERIGIPALILQVITGLTLAYAYIPDVSKWFSFETHVATHIFIKLVLLALTVALALDARLRIIPKLSAANLTSLALHIVAVTVISVLFVAFGAGIRTGGLF